MPCPRQPAIFSARNIFISFVLSFAHISAGHTLTISDLTSRESHSIECFCRDTSSPADCKTKELTRLQKVHRITNLSKLNKYYRTALFAFCDLKKCEGPVSLNRCLLTQLLDFKDSKVVRFGFDNLSNTMQSSLYSQCVELTKRGLTAVGECTVKKYTELRNAALEKQENDAESKKRETRLEKNNLKKQKDRLRKSQKAVEEKQRELLALINAAKETNRKSTDPADLYAQIAPSVYMLVAWTNHASSHTGSAVAVTNKLALTTCHIFKQHPHMELRTNNQRLPILIHYRNEKSDACIVKNMSGALKPIVGTRPYQSIVIGERIYALGSPEGLFNTFTEGLLSGKRTQDNQSLIQFSAPVTGGASGGGIFDTDGKLIGIIMKGQEKGNLGFAIPVEQFKKGQ